MKAKIGLWTLGLLFLAVGNLGAQVLFSTSFSSAQGYANGPITGQPAGGASLWMSGYTPPPDEFMTIENEALKVSQDGSDADTWTYIEFPNQASGMLTVRFDWQYVGPTDGSVDIGFCISDKANFEADGNPNLAWNEQSAMVRMQQDASVIDARNGDWAGAGAYDALAEYPYTDGKKISMRIEIDVDEADQVYSVFAKKEGESEVKLAENYGYRLAYVDGLNTLAIWMSGITADVSVIIDNIAVNGPADIPQWSLY